MIGVYSYVVGALAVNVFPVSLGVLKRFSYDMCYEETFVVVKPEVLKLVSICVIVDVK